MLFSSIIFAAGQLTVPSLPLIDVTTKRLPSVTLFTPEEPSTLVLALIAISLISAYVTISGRLGNKREVTQLSAPPQAGTLRKAA